MNNQTYNGWTNYATWRVNLEMVDGLDPREMFGKLSEIYDLADAIQQYCESTLEGESQAGLARDYAFAFLDDVNWLQIAEHMAEDFQLFQTETEVA
jgi:hypothetical protein